MVDSGLTYSKYFSLIPHAFGRNRPPVIRFADQLKREIDLMESLSELKAADDIINAGNDDVEEVHPLDHRFKSLGMREMTPVSPVSKEFSELSSYLTRTCGFTHAVSYQVQDIFRIEREGEVERFEKSGFAEMKSDRRLLWHGSRATNYGGILGQGLRIAPPEAPASGYMFGKVCCFHQEVSVGRADRLAGYLPRRHELQECQLLLLSLFRRHSVTSPLRS